MVNDCLVTKLKATVNNSNLEKLGILDFKAIKLDSVITNTQQKLEIHSVGDFTLRVSSPGQFVLNDTANFNIPSACYTELVLNTANANSTSGGERIHVIYFANENYGINIIDKHNVVGIKVQELSNNTVFQFDCNRFFTYPHLNLAEFGISLNKLGGSIDRLLNTDITKVKVRFGGQLTTGGFDNLSGSTSLTNLFLEYCNGLTGNIDALKDCVNLTELHMFRVDNVVGDIKNLAKLTSLTEASLGTGVGGAIEDFVAGQIANGRTTETDGILSLGLVAYRTINNITHPQGVETTKQWLCWDSANKFCVYLGKTNEAAPANKEACNNIYVNDATQYTSEIVTWKAAGKTIYDCKTGAIV